VLQPILRAASESDEEREAAEMMMVYVGLAAGELGDEENEEGECGIQ
jgi:hypothetical protein